MKIVKNTSYFDSKELKSLFCVIHNYIATKHKLGKLKGWKDLWICVAKKNKGRKHSGRAYLKHSGILYGNRVKGWSMYLSLNDQESIDEIIQLFGHELYHSYGYRHSEFPNMYALFTDKELSEIKKQFGKDFNVNLPKIKARGKTTLTLGLERFVSLGGYIEKCEDLNVWEASPPTGMNAAGLGDIDDSAGIYYIREDDKRSLMKSISDWLYLYDKHFKIVSINPDNLEDNDNQLSSVHQLLNSKLA